MRYLLDTHSVIWFIDGDVHLSATARQLMDDETNELFISIASFDRFQFGLDHRSMSFRAEGYRSLGDHGP